MESPIRRYQRTKDYQRHKLFRKMKRRRNAQIESVKDAPVRKLRRKLGIPKFAEGVRNLRFVGNDGRIVDDLGDDMLVLHDAAVAYGLEPQSPFRLQLKLPSLDELMAMDSPLEQLKRLIQGLLPIPNIQPVTNIFNV